MIYDGAALDQALHGAVSDPRTYLLRFYPDASVPPLDQVAADAAPLLAQINHGLWQAVCPCGRANPAVAGAAPGGVVFLDQPLVWCVCCGNEDVGSGWRPVAVPPEAERQQIEAVLMCRPKPENRNWESGDTIAAMLAENRAHADPVPEAA